MEFKVAVINFEGIDLPTAQDNQTGNRYAAVNPIIDFFELDRAGQHKKLKRMQEELCIDLKSIQVLDTKTNQRREMLFININHLPAYLYSIKQSRVKPELREKLRKFQIETTKAINDYWNKGATLNPRVAPEDLKMVIQQAITEYEKQRTDILATEIEKIKIQKAEVARRYISTLKELPNIDERYLETLGKFGVSLLTGEPIESKQQITVEEFLRAKKIYHKSERVSFGRFLAKYYKQKTGKAPRKSLSIINGKETLTNYYTVKDLPIFEEAFQSWQKQKKKKPALKG